MSRLIRNAEPGGWRDYLDNRPVHRGVGLELRLPGGTWARVRYETSGDEVVFHLAAGGAWESWAPPEGKRIGDTIYTSCPSCSGTGRLQLGDRCPECWGQGAPAGKRCEACDGSGAVQSPKNCDDCIDGRRSREVMPPDPPSGCLVFGARDLGQLDFRWPGERR